MSRKSSPMRRARRNMLSTPNPKDAFSIKKVPILSVVPLGVVARIALGMLEGALKYGRHNHRVIKVRASVYVDATTRHIAQFWEGQDIDSDSKIGLHHIDKALSSLTVLRDSILRGNWIDDRPPRSASDWLDACNKSAAQLVDQFSNPPPPYTQILIDGGKE